MTPVQDRAAPASWIPCTPETGRCQYWTWRQDYLRPECCTRHLRDILVFTEDLLTRHGIFHFLDYGSLLGAVRSGKLIDWDEDADFSCISSDLDNVLALRAEIESAGFWLDHRQAPHVLRICRSRTNQAHADLWFQRVQNGFASTWSVLHERRYRFPVEYLQQLGSVVLEGQLHPAPMPVERFLAEHRYGPDFMTPRRLPPNFGWIPNSALSGDFEAALRQLREIEYRIECLEASQANDAAASRPGWLERAGAAVPAPMLRAHRRLWMAKQWFAGARNPALLEIRYELYRRGAMLRLLESREQSPS